MTAFVVEVREPGAPPRRLRFEAGPVEVGRECEGVVIADPAASRRHLRFDSGSAGLSVVDLGSTNGTSVNGRRVTGSTPLGPGDVVGLAATAIEVVEAAVPESRSGEPPATAAVTIEPPPDSRAGVTVRPALDDLTARETEAAVIRYRPGSAGEAAAAGMAASVRRARRRLSGFGSEPWGLRPQVCLVDPFPDPERAGEVVTSGTVVDAGRAEVWMVVTPESPPEPPERSLALVFGASLPAAADLGVLLEGYGLHVAGTPETDTQLRHVDLPPFDTADGELAAAMALSFVRFLVKKGGDEAFRRLMAEARPGRVDAAAEDVLGSSLVALEETWRRGIAGDPPNVRARQFLRLSVQYLRPHVRREAEMGLYMILSLVFTMVFPFAFRRLLDTALPSGDFSRVMSILTFLGVAFLVSLLAGLRRTYLSAYVSASVVQEIRARMFGRLQALSSSWYSGHQQGDVVSRLFSDVAVLEAGLSQTLREGLFQLLSLVVSAAVLFALDPLLAIIVLAGAPLVALVYKGMGAGAERRSAAVQDRVGSLYALAAENYNAQPVVKAFGLEARERGRFGRASDRLFRAYVRLQLYSGLFGLSVNTIMTVLRLIVLGLGSWLILRGSLTIGGLVAFISVMGEVLAPVTVLTDIGQQVQASTGALARINDVLDAVPEVDDTAESAPLAPLKREIRLAGVGFSYTPERSTLDGLDAVIPAGTRVAFVGPTGAGKSSVLQLLMRFYDANEGSILFDGRDVRTATVASLRSQLGVVFQDTFLFDTSIRENIALGKPGATDAEIESAAKAAELHDFVTTLPRGYDTPVGERGGRLSGGQRQRLAIARALVRDPRVLVLDEATSALDPRTERLIADTLARVGEGRTTVAVTHRLASITQYDRIFVLVAGRLVEQGSHTELVSLGGTYAELWAEQSGGVAPSGPPLDAVAVLSRLALFGGLTDSELAAVAGRLRAVDLAPGATVPEGGGRLLFVRRGRPLVLAPGIGGDLAVAAELQPGDAFGLAALIGNESGLVLRADGPVALLVLDGDALAAVAAAYPSVAANLERRVKVEAAAPAGGRRLSRITMGPGLRQPSLAEPPPLGGPTAADVRRASGAFGAL